VNQIQTEILLERIHQMIEWAAKEVADRPIENAGIVGTRFIYKAKMESWKQALEFVQDAINHSKLHLEMEAIAHASLS
jgi:hypothetical protein